MELLMNYWYVIVGVIAVLIMIGISIYKFAGLPTKSQVAKIKEWLLYAVTKAETELGEKTGQLKLHTVYDMFIVRFPSVARIVSFETFSSWVDEALDEMKKMLENNKQIEELVKGDKN